MARDISVITIPIGSSWTASYDTNGEMLCRANGSATACVSAPQSGNVLAYDNEGRLTSWQNSPLGSSTDSFLYDGEGKRVQQVATASGTTTTTTYVASLEEITTTGSTTTTSAYYGGLALSVTQAFTSTLSYILSDGLGSVSEAVTLDGTVAATQLYGPYGAVRYQNGTLPGTRAYTGQRADAVTGLDYYNARYYDLIAGQFTSADTTLGGGLNHYTYVGGNPESATDPSGHRPDSQTSDYSSRLAYFQGCAQPHTYFGSPQQFVADSGQFFLGTDTLSQSYRTIFQDPQASTQDKVKAAGVATFTLVTDVVTVGSMLAGDPMVGEDVQAADEALLAADATDGAAVATSDAAAAASDAASDAATSDAVDNLQAVVDNGGGTAGDAGASIPNSTVIARGGQGDLDPPGVVFSGAQGQTVEEAGQGVVHGSFRWTTAGDIRAGGGTVEPAPELNAGVGRINYQHVDVCLGEGGCQWSDLVPNVAKNLRFGGTDYPFYDGYLRWGP